MNRLRVMYYQCMERIRSLGSPEAIRLKWELPKLTSYPSDELWRKLDAEKTKKLKEVVDEVEMISRVYRYFPENIRDSDWNDMIEMPTAKQRLDQLKHIRRVEGQRRKDQDKTVLKKEAAKERMALYGPREPLATYLSVPGFRLVRMEKEREAQRYINSLLVEKPPTVVFDCRYLSKMSHRGLNLTAMQLHYVASHNRDRKNPWPMYFVNCNFEASRAVIKAREKHLRILDSPTMIGPECTKKNYTELFPREKIVYLSPDAEEELEEVIGDEVFVIGGIVDRVTEHGIPKHASKEAADKDNVRSVRLPLDKYISWKSGTKYLTLMAVMNILKDVYETKDWPSTLDRHIPVRNVRDASEKNAIDRDKHKRFRELDRHVIRTLRL
ncbi:hypothetical protein L596_016343 [Steinernema carpocapsae]|uniref:RNA (guanine-9-)-methyltransferase domain-containing protein 1 n=1 Tax=Steinernema carpocapsae TaxID=34508 RepID=A0A4U5NIS2_STECR|nr:hypothetical protein L596_016343 [Steinernema carpocapsae]